MRLKHHTRVTELVDMPCRDCETPTSVRVIIVGAHLSDMVVLCTPCLMARTSTIRAERRPRRPGGGRRRKQEIAA